MDADQNTDNAPIQGNDFTEMMEVTKADIAAAIQPSETETPETDDAPATEEGSDEEQEDDEAPTDDQKPADGTDDPDIAALLASESHNDDIEALRSQLAQLEARIAQKPEDEPKAIEFVGEEEFDDILQDRAKLNAKLNAVYEQATFAATTQAAAYVQHQIQLQQVANQFYSDNPDLKPHTDFVSQVSEKLIKLYPNITQAQLLQKAALATRIYKKLPIPRAGSIKGKATGDVPQLPNVRSRAGNPQKHEKPDAEEAEFDRMLTVLGR